MLCNNSWCYLVRETTIMVSHLHENMNSLPNEASFQGTLRNSGIWSTETSASFTRRNGHSCTRSKNKPLVQGRLDLTGCAGGLRRAWHFEECHTSQWCMLSTNKPAVYGPALGGA